MVDRDERFYIATTRFTNYTYRENLEWRERFKWKGCVYGCNKKMPLTVPHLAVVYVIEMNNDTNEIMGVQKNAHAGTFHSCDLMRHFAMLVGAVSALAACGVARALC